MLPPFRPSHSSPQCFYIRTSFGTAARSNPRRTHHHPSTATCPSQPQLQFNASYMHRRTATEASRQAKIKHHRTHGWNTLNSSVFPSHTGVLITDTKQILYTFRMIHISPTNQQINQKLSRFPLSLSPLSRPRQSRYIPCHLCTRPPISTAAAESGR